MENREAFGNQIRQCLDQDKDAYQLDAQSQRVFTAENQLRIIARDAEEGRPFVRAQHERNRESQLNEQCDKHY